MRRSITYTGNDKVNINIILELVVVGTSMKRRRMRRERNQMVTFADLKSEHCLNVNVLISNSNGGALKWTCLQF